MTCTIDQMQKAIDQEGQYKDVLSENAEEEWRNLKIELNFEPKLKDWTS